MCNIDRWLVEADVKNRELSLVLCDDLEGWHVGWGRREVQEGGDICIHIADSLHCAADTNTTFQSNLLLLFNH